MKIFFKRMNNFQLITEHFSALWQYKKRVRQAEKAGHISRRGKVLSKYKNQRFCCFSVSLR